jgi:hypothetical protein
VDKRERVEEFQRGTRIHDRVRIGIATGSDVRPMAERRAKAFAACEHKRAQCGERFLEVGVDRSPPFDLDVEEPHDPHLGAAADFGQTRRDPGDAPGRRWHRVSVRRPPARAPARA